MDGVINVVKPKDWTSFDVIAKLRRIYHQKKIGHGGTLDPEASGVLPVCVGSATRLFDYIIDKRKIKDNEPLKELGTYDIRVELYKDVIGKIKVKLIEE